MNPDSTPVPAPVPPSLVPPPKPPSSLVATLLILMIPAMLATLFGLGALHLQGDNWLVPFFLVTILGSVGAGAVAGLRLASRFAPDGRTHPAVSIACVFGCIVASFVSCFVGCVGSAMVSGWF